MEFSLDPPGGAKFIIQCGGACFSSSLIRMLVSYIRSLLLDGALFSSLIVIEEKESERRFVISSPSDFKKSSGIYGAGSGTNPPKKEERLVEVFHKALVFSKK